MSHDKEMSDLQEWAQEVMKISANWDGELTPFLHFLIDGIYTHDLSPAVVKEINDRNREMADRGDKPMSIKLCMCVYL